MLKLSTAILLVAAAIHHNLDTILQLPLSQPSLAPELMMRVLLKILFQLVLLLSALALLDKLYTRWTFAKDNRMSKQEIKEEYKQRDGDPKIKAKIKQLQFQLRLKTASLKQVRTADLIITNPTHLAIALKYDKQIMPAPKVVCKAQGEAVELIKKIARKHRIPIIENKPFARALYHSIALNQWISSDLYPIAAELFREIYAQKESA